MKKIALILLSGVLPLFSSVNETIPPWHWTYEYIEDLQICGLFQDLYQLNQPFSRGDIAKSLLETGYKIKQNEIRLSDSELKRYKFMVREFLDEIHALQGKADSTEIFNLGAYLDEDIVKHSEEDPKLRGIYHTRIHVPVSNDITLYNGIAFDQYLVHDPDYIGKKWRGIVGYTEQAYAYGKFNRFRLKFGRDFIKWGAGQNGTLIFSNARPFDQFIGSVDVGPFRFSYLFSRLDDWRLSSLLTDSLGGHLAQRYVSAHRLDASFFSGRLQCAVSEVAIFGGIHRSPEWIFLNPFIFYHGAQMNENSSANTLGSIDLLWSPARRWQCYGSFMIDDIQIEKTGPSDLEPSEIGYLLGTRWAPTGGTLLSAEYVRVTNRTYKTPNPWETFVYKNVSMGHPNGNDFDHWQIGITQWIGSSFQGKMMFGQTRQGEGDLFSQFDMPWMNFTVKEGYLEPFPTGIVEQSSDFHLTLRYIGSLHWGLRAELLYTDMKNHNHLKGENETQVYLKVGIWLNGDVTIRL